MNIDIYWILLISGWIFVPHSRQFLSVWTVLALINGELAQIGLKGNLCIARFDWDLSDFWNDQDRREQEQKWKGKSRSMVGW